MRSVNKFFAGVDSEGKHVFNKEIYGTSEETKPTDGIATGSAFIEVNTGKVYFFNENTGSWIEQ